MARRGFPGGTGGDPDGAIHALDGALVKAGLPGALDPAVRILERAQRLADAGRAEREAARTRLDAATRVLMVDGPVDLSAYSRVLAEVGPWISDDGPASVGVGDAARQVRARAAATVFAMASGLHRQLRDRCCEVVAGIAAVPAPPAGVWSTQTVADAGGLMIRAGRETDWAQFVRLSDQWDAIHAAGRLVRETNQFGGELLFTGPTDLCLVFLNWEPAVGPEQIKQLPGPLRVRRAIDLGWRPGLWLKSDHDRFAADRDKPKRRLLGVLAAGSRSEAG